MAAMQSNSLESFQDLHAELLALSEDRLAALENLSALVRSHIQALKGLLDKKARNEHSRKIVEAGEFLDLAWD